MADEREIRCRHCDARNSLTGCTDATFVVEVGDGVPYFCLRLDEDSRTVTMTCDICDKEGPWGEMGYIWFPGITDADKEEQREPWA